MPAVDADGNEAAGIRLPWISVPLATYTGWNLQSGELAEGELAGLLGSSFAFPRTRSEREAGGDPRLSLEERYANADDYLGQVRERIGALVEARYMLAEDADALSADCLRTYQEAMAVNQGSG